jgi:hypothetical protein
MSAARTLYERSIVVDACAPLAPIAPVHTAFSPDERVDAYAKAGVTFAIFSIVDDLPNSIEQTTKPAIFLGPAGKICAGGPIGRCASSES